MKLKLSLSSFLAVILVFIGGLCVSANPIENLDIISENLKNADSFTCITKGDFAYTISKILGSGDLNNEADYILYANSYGYLISDGDADEIIDFHTFNEVSVKMIGYESVSMSYGGGENGNFRAVLDAKLYKNVDISTYDKITMAQFKQLIYNLLTVETMKYEYSYNGNVNYELNGKEKNVLTEIMNISAYEGVIKSADSDACVVEIQDNIFSHNPVILTPGQQFSFYSGNCVDLYKFEYAPAEIWVDENDRILFIQPLKSVEIFYDVIYSVNNDDAENKYAIDYVSKIEFLRNKKSYDVSSDCIFVYNEEETTEPTVFAKKFAKIIKVDGKITLIETWDLEDGGLITEVTNDSITYQKGQYNAKITGLSSYDKSIVIIDSKSTDRTQIKTDSVFSVYKNKDANSIVIVVSEKMRAGTLESVGVDRIGIDGVYYDCDSNTYFSKDGKTYKKNEYYGMFNNLVAAYTDYFNKVKYVKVIEANILKTNKYLAYATKVYKDDFDETYVRLYTIEPEIKKFDYKLSEKVKYEDGLSEGSLVPITKTNAHDAILEFEINGKNEIRKISLPEQWYLYGKTSTLQETAKNFSFPLFENTSDPTIYIAVNASTNPSGTSHLKTYLYDAQYIVICEENGELVPKKASWNELLCKTSTGVKMTLYANEDESTPRLAVIYGETENIAHYTKIENAIITKMELTYDEESDEIYYDAVFLNSSGENTMKISQETGETLSKNMFITYKPQALFNENGFIITNKLSLPSNFQQWIALDNMEGGRIEKVDKYRLFSQDGRAYQMDPNCAVFGVDMSSRNPPGFTSMSLDEIQHGDYCVYNVSNTNHIQILFVDITGR